MSISGIQGTSDSGYIYPFSGDRGHTEAITPVPSTRSVGRDTASFSEEALRLAGAQSGDGGTGEETTASITASANTAGAPVPKKSLFSIMLESIFLAELEESGAGNCQSGSAGAAPSEDGNIPQDRPAQAAKSANPLQDGAKVASLKKVMNDVVQGKADISDLPKAMAVGKGGTGSGTGANNMQKSAASAKSEEKETAIL